MLSRIHNLGSGLLVGRIAEAVSETAGEVVTDNATPNHRERVRVSEADPVHCRSPNCYQ